MSETWVRSLGREDFLEKEMAIHSSTIAWKIPWTEEPGRLQSMGSQRVRHDWETSPCITVQLISLHLFCSLGNSLLWQPLVCSLYLWVLFVHLLCFLDPHIMWGHLIFVFPCLDLLHLLWCSHDPSMLSQMAKFICFSLFHYVHYNWIIFHCTYILQFLCAFTHPWTQRVLPRLGCCKYCCSVPGGCRYLFS